MGMSGTQTPSPKSRTLVARIPDACNASAVPTESGRLLLLTPFASIAAYLFLPFLFGGGGSSALGDANAGANNQHDNESQSRAHGGLFVFVACEMRMASDLRITL